MYLNQIKSTPWVLECDMTDPFRAMTVQIGFSHKENEMDETEFCIDTFNVQELAELFDVFCKENKTLSTYQNQFDEPYGLANAVEGVKLEKTENDAVKASVKDTFKALITWFLLQYQILSKLRLSFVQDMV